MSAPPRRRAWLAALFAFVAAVVVLAHELITGSPRQRDAIADAIPGFVCAAMAIRPAGGSWSPGHHLMRSSLRMPPACLADLKRRIRADPRFHETRCNLVERCWERADGTRRYTLTFYPDRTAFRFAAD